jgi:hypothetical protein
MRPVIAHRVQYLTGWKVCPIRADISNEGYQAENRHVPCSSAFPSGNFVSSVMTDVSLENARPDSFHPRFLSQ